MSTSALALALLLIAGPAVANAQETPSPDEIARRAEQFLKGRGQAPSPAAAPTPTPAAAPGAQLNPPASPQSSDSPVVPLAPGRVEMAPETAAEYQAALREYYGYFKSGISHRRDVFSWQLFSSRIIFWVVLSLVAAGMYFAAVQFQRGLGRRRAVSADDVTEIAASLGGVKVRSPVLGVVILVISLAFFYLYLRFVYAVTSTF
jgi:hypothetical protein